MAYTVTLAAARVNKNLTQRDVAEKLGRNVGTIRNWESGKSIPDAIEFQDLCNLYGVSPDIIFLPRRST